MPLDPRYIYGIYGVLKCQEALGRSGSTDKDFARTYTRKFIIEVDDPNVGVVAVRAALFFALKIGVGFIYEIGHWDAVANTGDPFYEYDGSVCVGLSFQQDEIDGLQWAAVATFGPFDPRLNGGGPLGQKQLMNWDAEQFEQIVDEDIDGNAIVNSAGDYFDPPVTGDQSRPILTITRNQKFFDPSVAETYADTVNSAPFYGRPPRTMKMAAPVARQLYSPLVYEDGYYWEVTYTFHGNRYTWDKILLDQGMRQKAGGAREQVIVDGAPVSSPVLLSGGTALAPGGEPEFLAFQIYPGVDYATVFGFDGASDDPATGGT